MINLYNNYPTDPPVPDGVRQQALQGLRMASPYEAYNQNHADNLMAAQDQATAQYNLAASQANTEYEMRRRDSERQSALAGLGLMYDARQQDLDMGNRRLDTMLGIPRMLGGLFR
jgi:hypothetical protein